MVKIAAREPSFLDGAWRLPTLKELAERCEKRRKRLEAAGKIQPTS